jgi:sialic acid synthase SpsE
MKIGEHDTDASVFVIAEIGNNHEGDLGLAKRMVAAAARIGVQAVKFQTLRAEGLVRPEDRARFETLKRFELSFKDYEELAKTAKDEGVTFLSTPFDLEACAFLNDLVPAFKIASGDNTFYPLLERVASYGKPVILSTGMATLAEIRFAVALIERTWADAGMAQELALLHCVSLYPAPPAAANLRRIHLLGETFGRCVGYSDHTLGITAAIAAVAMGAQIIEKHFTLDKNQSSFQDHKLSAQPDEMAELVRRIREVEVFLDSTDEVPSAPTPGNRGAARRSVAVKASLPKGHRLVWDDLCWLRPGDGLAPGSEHLVLGRKLRQDIVRGTLISTAMVE